MPARRTVGREKLFWQSEEAKCQTKCRNSDFDLYLIPLHRYHFLQSNDVIVIYLHSTKSLLRQCDLSGSLLPFCASFRVAVEGLVKRKSGDREE